MKTYKDPCDCGHQRRRHLYYTGLGKDAVYGGCKNKRCHCKEFTGEFR